MKSLLQTVQPAFAKYRLQSVKVLREVRTDSNKSIDLVIVTDSFVVGVENKIYHDVYNPFEEYGKRLKAIASKNGIPEENVLKILLSLRPQSGDTFGFQPVTYGKFFSILRQHLGRSLGDADQRWLGFLVDFIMTIENLGGSPMDENFIQFVKENKSDALRFHLMIEQMKGELRQKMDGIRVQIELPKFGFEQRWKWDNDLTKDDDFFDCIYTYANTNDGLKISVETKLFLTRGWIISCWSEDFKKASAWLARNGIVAKKTDTARQEWIYERFKEEKVSPEEVAKKYQQLIDEIAEAIEKEIVIKG